MHVMNARNHSMSHGGLDGVFVALRGNDAPDLFARAKIIIKGDRLIDINQA